jgi:hypothetical protein
LREEVNRGGEYILSLKAVITTPVWRNKPKLDVGSGKGRTINPDRWYAKGTHIVAAAGASHSVYVSHSKEVADAIESAARAVSKQLGLRKESHSELQTGSLS